MGLGKASQPELHYPQPMSDDSPVDRDSSALRILVVLETLASMEQPATLPGIVERAQLEKFKTYRALRTLQERGFVDHAPGRGYWIGSRSHALASLIGARPAVLRRARPVLKALAELAGAGAALHLRSGSHRVLVTAVVPRRLSAELAANPIPVGERAPLTSGCSGTSILAFLPEHEIETVLASRHHDEPRLSHTDLAQIRANGYATSFSANHRGLNGVGAPLLDPFDAAPLGSIALAGPDTRLGEGDLHRLSAPLITACDKLGGDLGQMLGPHSHHRRAALDVTVKNVLDS